MSVGKLVSHGSAPYKDDPKNSRSYFVELENEGKTHKIWGVDLENAMEHTSAKIGDMVTVNNLGSKEVTIPDPNDPDKSKVVNRNEWEVETYEPYQNLNNAIEHDEERELQKTQTVEKTKENNEPVKLQKPKLSEFEASLPDSVKNNYVAIAKNRFLQDEKINYYDKSDPDKVNIAFEDRKNGLHTSRQDEKTIRAMMDLAESKGWTAIKLKGTEEFKQKAWLEASLRGIETKGYEPTEKDKAELIAKQEARTVNHVDATAVKEPIVAPQETTQEKAKEQQIESPTTEKNQAEHTTQFEPRQFTTHDESLAFVHQELLNNGWEMKDDGRGKFPTKTFLDKDNKEHHVQVTDHDYVLHISSDQKPDKAEKTPYIHREVMGAYMTKEFASDIVKNIEKQVEKYTQDFDLTARNQQSVIVNLAEVYDPNFNRDSKGQVIDAQLDELHHEAMVNHMVQQVEENQRTNSKSDKDIKAEIREITQNGYKAGTITNRSDLVNVLTDQGYEVVKENEKSIRLKIPYSDQHLTLKGEMFTKDFDALKQLKANLEPETIKERYPQISDTGIAQITAWKNHMLDKYETPQAQQHMLNRLETSVADVANGKDLGMPPIPDNEIKPDIEVQINTGDKSRSR